MKKVLYILFFLVSTTAFSQRVAIDYGDIYYDFFQFKEAANYYEKALATAKPKHQQYLYEQLSQCYKYLFQYERAEEYFEKLMNSGAPVSPEYYIDYGNVLKLNGKYKEAKEAFKRHDQLTGSELAEPSIRSVSWAIRNADTIKNYAIYPTDLNISKQALGYCFYDDGLLYAHARNKPMGKNQIPLFDLDYAKKVNNTEFVKDLEYMALIEFDLNEGSPCVSPDGQTLFFSANSTTLKKGRTKKIGSIEVSDEGVSNFKIYAARMEAGLFQNPVELPFNNKQFSCVHPCISADGKTLYFSSNMPGGFGGFDLYRSGLQENGTWSEAMNMGKTVNTEENEIFPWVSEDLFYFASKGFNNYGGYDIFVAQINKSQIPHTLKNIGQPINSFRDDVAFITKDGGRTGYFSSNRGNEEGTDNVYYFHETKPRDVIPATAAVDSMMAARANALKSNTQNLAAGAQGKPVTGTVPAVQVPNATTPAPATGAAPVAQGPRTTKPVAKADNMNEAELVNKNFSPVFFKFNQSGITSGQMEAADSVAQILGANAGLKVYIAAHTDSRGSFSYNMGLSDRRAASIKRYLLSKGVPASRIITKGLGESQLLNECADGMPCSESQHRINRRVNMKLVK